MSKQYINKFIVDKQQQLIHDLNKCNDRIKIINNMKNMNSETHSQVNKILFRKYQLGGGIDEDMGGNILKNKQTIENKIIGDVTLTDKDGEVRKAVEKIASNYLNTWDNLNKINNLLGDLKKKNEDLKKENDELLQQIIKLENQKKDLENELNNKNLQISNLQNGLEENYKKLQEKLQNKDKEISDLNEQLKGKPGQEVIDNLRNELDQLKREKELLEKENNSLDTELKRLRNLLKILENVQSLTQNIENATKEMS